MKATKTEIIIEDHLPLYSLTVGQFRELIRSEQEQIKFPPEEPMEQLMKLKDVLALLQVSRSTLFSWKKQGVIIAYTVRGSLFFKKNEIMELFNKKKSKKQKEYEKET